MAKREGAYEWMNDDSKLIMPENDDKSKWIILAGNPLEGLEVFGPFESNDEASRYAYDFPSTTEWWTTQLQSPEE